MKEEDRNFLRFLWWEYPQDKKFKIYRHRRVVFGVNCSPCLLAAVVGFHLNNVADVDKNVAQKLLKSLYVDNCVTSEDTTEDCLQFMEKSTRMLADAKMELRQWEFGSTEVSGIGQLVQIWCGLDTTRIPLLGGQNSLASVLGLKWNKSSDNISCDLTLTGDKEKVTKRSILSSTQKIFDPIGFTCPTTLQPKLILQSLWECKLGWDDELPNEVKTKFENWRDELDILQTVQIPRNMTGGNSSRESWQLHIFCDASKYAYAAVVFLRTGNGYEISVQLIQAKARVAPLRKTTIPRLELLGCTIAARLTVSVKDSLSISEIPTFYWTDSSTALAWIRRNDDWGTFVGNRVKEICRLTKTREWRHVPGVMNPADLPSRGCSPSQLLNSQWWEGPQWLKRMPEEWPSQDMSTDENEVLAERKKGSVACLITIENETPWYQARSTWKKNLLTVASMTRFVAFILTHGQPQNKGPLRTEEIESGEKRLVKLIQLTTIPDNEAVVSGIPVLKDAEGIIRVKTKLSYRDNSFGFRYPALLTSSHSLVDQIIENEHLNNNHAGVQFLMGKLQEKYWIIQGRRAIRRVLAKCVRCKRFQVKKVDVIPAPLPQDRVSTSKVFEVIGVDLAGPLYLKKNKKVWIVIFTCAVYRCVHLELVKSLSTEAFLDAFSRFKDRRGRPSVVYCDNGTNFTGTANALKELDWEKIQGEHGLVKMKWKFNPPAAPWWSGWWERLIRSVKDLLRRTLGQSCLTYEKLRTCICDIEAVINGRPLTTVSEDPDDLIPLTPAMFLHEVPCPNIMDYELLDASGFQKLYQKRKDTIYEFKMRFRREYLAQLVQRAKEKNVREFQVGDVVLVGADNKKRWEWPLAKILELMPGRDGNIRVAKVKTANGTLIRPVQRLYPLEVSSPQEIPKVVPEEIPIVPQDRDKTGKIHQQDKLPEARTRRGREVKVPGRYRQ